MSNIGQIFYNIYDPNQGKRITSIANLEINSELIAQYSESKIVITKLGVQAPSNTKFTLNGKSFMIGRSGIYEIEDVTIDSVIFEGAPDYFIIDFLYQEG